MSRSRDFLILVLASLLFSLHLTVTPAVAVVKAGTNCTKVGALSMHANKRFICVKKGKKLVWKNLRSKTRSETVSNPADSNPTSSNWKDPLEGTPCETEGAIIPNKIWELRCLMPSKIVPGSTDNGLIWFQNYIEKDLPIIPKGKLPSKEVTYETPTVPSVNLEFCKIPEVSSTRTNLASGFPVIAPLTPRTGKVKWALIPIDFADMPGDVNFRNRIDEQIKSLSEYINTVSEGSLSIEWVVQPSWVRMPGPSSQYNITYSDDPDRNPEIDRIYKDLMRESDKVFDFTNIQVVNFIAPLGQNFIRESVQGFPWTRNVQNVTTNEGVVPAFTFVGRFFNTKGREYWSYWAHEYGHTVGIGHIGSSREENPYSGYDLMSIQDGPSREISGWLRFIMGWMPDEKVHCSDKSSLNSVDLTLAPLNGKKEGIKMSVVRLSSNRALIIESRRVTKFTCNTPTPLNGVMAYIYDARLGHYEAFLIPVIPTGRNLEQSDCQTIPAPNPLLREGDKVNVEGITIEVLQHGTYDRVRISRL